MRGSTVQKPKGTGKYYVVLDLERDTGTGKRKQKWHSGHATEREAERALAGLLAARYDGSYVEPSKLTLAVFLRERWLPTAAATVRSTTLDCYRRHCERYLIPRLGAVPLQGLTSDRLTLLYRELHEQGSVKGRPLSPSVRRVHATLHRALRDAQSWGCTTRNLASSATKPRVPRLGERLQTWSGDEVAAFLDAVRDDRLYAAWHLAVSTGMRRS